MSDLHAQIMSNNTREWLSEWAISGYGYVLKYDFIHWSSDYLVNHFCSFWNF